MTVPFRSLVCSIAVFALGSGCNCSGTPNPDGGEGGGAGGGVAAGGGAGGGNGTGGGVGGSGGAGGGLGGGSAGGGSGGDGGVVACSGNGLTCATSAECCSGLQCRSDTTGAFKCVIGTACFSGGACQTSGDCCSLNCVGGMCMSGGLCTKTGASCQASDPGACCTGVCTGGSCAQPPGSSCNVAGDSCSMVGTSPSCCSKACVDMDPDAGSDLRCASIGQCRSNGEPCRSSDQCCSATCGANGVCAQPPVSGTCLVVGSACQARSDCCSGLCANDGTGFNVCHFLGGCRPEEELCRSEQECCGFASPSKGTAPVCERFGDAGVGRCRNLNGDAPAGEICEASRPNFCIPQNRTCVLTISGIRRCLGTCGDGGTCSGTADGGQCLAVGQSCASPDQCCGRICAPSELGFTCAAACIGQGGRCSTGADCCLGFCNLQGFCGTPGTTGDGGTTTLPDGGTATLPDGGTLPQPDAGPPLCRPLGGACTGDAQCCSTKCDPIMMTCIPNIT